MRRYRSRVIMERLPEIPIRTNRSHPGHKRKEKAFQKKNPENKICKGMETIHHRQWFESTKQFGIKDTYTVYGGQMG